jgi:hypothetical protein
MQIDLLGQTRESCLEVMVNEGVRFVRGRWKPGKWLHRYVHVNPRHENMPIEDDKWFAYGGMKIMLWNCWTETGK